MRHRLLRAARGLVRLVVIAAVMMGVGKLLEEVLSHESFARLKSSQRAALAAVDGIDPWQIKRRFVCALMPSVEMQNRSLPVRFQQREESDCGYVLALAGRDSLAGAPVSPVRPRPVVGHWANGTSMAPAAIAIALLDTGWHLVVQPSLFATLFALFSFVAGGVIAGALMLRPRITWHPSVGPMILCLGTVAAACGVAAILRLVMWGGLMLFGWVTGIAGLCWGASCVTFFGGNLLTKTAEVKLHEIVEHFVPR